DAENRTEGRKMNKVFLFTRTKATVASSGIDSPGIVSTIMTAIGRTVRVRTSVTIGAGAIVADRVITSLLLVANESEVAVRFKNGADIPAFVTRRDSRRNLAELLPSSRALSSAKRLALLTSSPDPKVGKMGEIGHPLLVVCTDADALQVHVGSTLYGIEVMKRLEESWNIRPNAPMGLIGGGVWSTDGTFMGLALGEKDPFFETGSRESSFPKVYALPGREVMEFAESSV
ncbi:MAG TPA: hypothetical protein DEP25_02640, partial [Candidatus Taylorbacteria bacterium]|nr:hypothetical protein [Candidatus Taylorbacteria bacterium]